MEVELTCLSPEEEMLFKLVQPTRIQKGATRKPPKINLKKKRAALYTAANNSYAFMGEHLANHKATAVAAAARRHRVETVAINR